MDDFEQVKYRIELALHRLYKNDHFLITNGANERSITHKLAEHLQIFFPEYHVDCEYNRRGENRPKNLPGQTTSYPDIIIHKRNTKDNLLVIEAKSVKSKNHSDEDDKRKIKAYIKDARYGYRFGLWVCFDDEITETKRDWFNNMNGECIEVNTDE